MYHPENDPQHIGLTVNDGVADAPKINPYARPKRTRVRYSAEQYVDGILRGDISILGQAVTLIESSLDSDQELAQQVIERCLPHSGKAVRLGILMEQDIRVFYCLQTSEMIIRVLQTRCRIRLSLCQMGTLFEHMLTEVQNAVSSLFG